MWYNSSPLIRPSLLKLNSGHVRELEVTSKLNSGHVRELEVTSKLNSDHVRELAVTSLEGDILVSQCINLA